MGGDVEREGGIGPPGATDHADPRHEHQIDRTVDQHGHDRHGDAPARLAQVVGRHGHECTEAAQEDVRGEGAQHRRRFVEAGAEGDPHHQRRPPENERGDRRLDDQEDSQTGRERPHVGSAGRPTSKPGGDAERDRAPGIGEQHRQLDRRTEDADRACTQKPRDDQHVDLRESRVRAVDDQEDAGVAGDPPGIGPEARPRREDARPEGAHEQQDAGCGADHVTGRAAERGPGGAGARKHQGDARDQLDRALGERDAQLQVDPPDRREHDRHQHHAIGEHGERHGPDRPSRGRDPVRGGDRLGKHREQHGDDERDEHLETEPVGHDGLHAAVLLTMLCNEPRHRGRDAEVGGQQHQRGDAEREREDPVAARPQLPRQEDHENRGERGAGQLDGERQRRVALDRVRLGDARFHARAHWKRGATIPAGGPPIRSVECGRAAAGPG